MKDWIGRPASAALPAAITGLFLALIGALRVLDAYPIAGLWTSLLLLLLLAAWAGARVARPRRAARVESPARRLGAGAVAGLVFGLVVGLAGLYLRSVDLSRVLVRIGPEAGAALTFGQAGILGAIVPAAGSLVAGAIGAALTSVARWDRRRSTLGRQLYRRWCALTDNGRRDWLPSLLLVLLLVVAAPLVGSYWGHVLGSIGLYVLLGLGLNIVVGYAGLLDLGYVAFFAIGAYSYAFLAGSNRAVTDLPFLLVLPLCMLLAAIGGVLLGVPVLRLRGDYLAIVTLGFGEIIRILMQNLVGLTGGPQGILQIARPSLTGFELAEPLHFFYLVLAGCVLIAFVSVRLNDSRLGRAWIAIREDEDVARALGVNTWQYKLLAFGIGASFAGLGGAIFASRQSAIFPVDFSLLVSIYVLCLVIIGGMGSIPGVIVGAVILVGLPEVLRELSDYRLLAFGALLVLTMVVRPQGLVPSWRRAQEMEDAEEREAETHHLPPQTREAGA